jgi:hypothetical protein
MTVKELIDLLNKINDKKKEIYILDGIWVKEFNKKQVVESADEILFLKEISK